MSDIESGVRECNMEKSNDVHGNLLERIENAYRIYKLSEVFLNDVSDDYGKQKIAELRFEFARHQLLVLLKEARDKGVKWTDVEVIKNFLYPGL